MNDRSKQLHEIAMTLTSLLDTSTAFSAITPDHGHDESMLIATENGLLHMAQKLVLTALEHQLGRELLSVLPHSDAERDTVCGVSVTASNAVIGAVVEQSPVFVVCSYTADDPADAALLLKKIVSRR